MHLPFELWVALLDYLEIAPCHETLRLCHASRQAHFKNPEIIMRAMQDTSKFNTKLSIYDNVNNKFVTIHRKLEGMLMFYLANIPFEMYKQYYNQPRHCYCAATRTQAVYLWSQIKDYVSVTLYMKLVIVDFRLDSFTIQRNPRSGNMHVLHKRETFCILNHI